MKWKQFTIKTTTEAEDLVCDMLTELGVSGVEVQDRQPNMVPEDLKMYEEVMPAMEADDGLAEVLFYLDEDEDETDILRAVREGLEELQIFVNVGEGTITSGETEDVDWVNNWKTHFHEFYVDDLLIKPTWVEMPAEHHASMVLEIDPGTAFGTGSHETTQLCIRALKKQLKGNENVLDLGTGSGILAIYAIRSGAKYAYGIDIDPLAVKTARENAELNGVSEAQFTLEAGNAIGNDEMKNRIGIEKYDIVVANILADVIIPLQKEVTPNLKHGGIMIVSGIINMKEEAVRNAILANDELEIIDQDVHGEWVSFTMVRK